MAVTDAELRERCVAVAHQAMEVDEHRGTPAEPAAWREHRMAGWPAIYEIRILEGTDRAHAISGCWARLMGDTGLMDEALKRAIVSFVGMAREETTGPGLSP